MKLSQVLAPQVDARTRDRGAAYVQSGAVRSLTSEHGIIEATVRGSVLYHVWIEPADSDLSVSCTCPYFIDHVEVCKHVWAVVLDAEAQGIPLLVPGVKVEDVDLIPLDPVDYDEILEAERTWQPKVPSPPRPARPPAPPAPPPPWRQLFDSLGGRAAPAQPQRARLAPGQLLYVIDAAASAKSDTLVVDLMSRDRKMNGEWGKPRLATVTSGDIRSHPDAAERAILERLAGARPHVEWSGYYNDYGQQLSRLQVGGILAIDIVPLLCATGRCLIRLPANPGAAPAPSPAPVPTALYAARPKPDPPATLVPLAWDDGPPWMFTIAIRREQGDGGYTVEGWLAREDERVELSDPVLLLSDGIVVISRRFAATTEAADSTHADIQASARVGRYVALAPGTPSGTHAPSAWLTTLRRAGPLTIPQTAREDLIDALLAASPQVAEAPDELRIETVPGLPRPHLRLRPASPRSGRADRVCAELAFEYEGTIVPHESPAPVVRSDRSTLAIRRAPDEERQALERLLASGCRLEWSHETGDRTLQLPSRLMPQVVRRLLDEGWHVEAAGRTYRRPGSPTLAVSSGIDWFDLHGHVDYDDQRVSLPRLLAALDRGETFVTLDDGTVGLLPEEWLRRHAPLARLGTASGNRLRFRPSQIALLDVLIASQPDAVSSWDDTFARARSELRAFEGIRPADPPRPAFTGSLRGYQRDGLGWLLFLQHFGFGGCLADDMGLGKTVMVLALLATRHEARGDADRLPSLVVAPRSVVFNWRQEAARFAPSLRVLEYLGAGRAEMRASFADHDVVLTTYGTLRRDASELSAVKFDYVVLDEAQAIKNAASVSAKTTRVLQAGHRLALSGTPIENHFGELWSLFEFLNPGLLSTSTAFDRVGRGQRLDDETVALLARGLRPFILRRTKEQVAGDLPPKTEQTLYCELERPQRTLYDELRAHYRRTLLGDSQGNGFGRAKLHVLEALLRLRQAACHPGLIDRHRKAEASAKLDVLVPRLVEAAEEGHKTLVFSQFTSLLSILRAFLDENGMRYEYLDGRTRDREAKVTRFQGDPACRLFLISLKAGGLGLNLTAADYVFLLDPWWNPAVEAQAIDRTHRIGQSRRVFAYRLIARDTVEERVLELQQHKRKLADAILTADNSLIRGLSREDLELLLS